MSKKRNITFLMSPQMFKYLHFAVLDNEGVLELRYKSRLVQPVYDSYARFLCDMGYLKYMNTEVIADNSSYHRYKTTIKRYRVTQAGKDRLLKEGYSLDIKAAA